MTSLTHVREVYEDGRMDGFAEEKIPAEEPPEILEKWVRLSARAGSFADYEENTKEK